MPDTIEVRPVNADDEVAVRALLQPHVEQKKLLRRTIDELETLLPNGFVAVCGSELAGFATLEVYSEKLAEIRALVVAEGQQGNGVGQKLVRACVERARQRGIMEVMAISSAERFFHSCGFDFTLPDEKKAFFIQTASRQ
ncbi:MAG: N-acetylglutamate synthase [Planctomycetaceae bacterium]|jgi:amino-acid N-acetyltransferase|nr:N-acetylglutamate synthase [Planctomycetaceae bacterium]